MIESEIEHRVRLEMIEIGEKSFPHPLIVLPDRNRLRCAHKDEFDIAYPPAQ